MTTLAVSSQHPQGRIQEIRVLSVYARFWSIETSFDQGVTAPTERLIYSIYSITLEQQVRPEKLFEPPCHAKIGPSQKWTPGPVLAAKSGPPVQFWLPNVDPGPI